MSLNNVVLVGNLTRDTEVKYLPSGSAVGNTGIATNRKYGDKEEVCFVDLVMFGKTAEVAGEYGVKGKQIAVVGRLKLEQWETDGQKRSKIVVVVDNMQLMGGGNGDGKAAKSSNKPAKTEEEIPF